MSRNSPIFDGERLLIVSTVPVITRNLIWAAGQAGLECIVATDTRNAPCLRMPHVRNVLSVSLDDLLSEAESLFDLLEENASENRAVIVPGGTRSTRYLSRNAERFEIPCSVFPTPSSDVFEGVHDKGRFAELLKTFDLPRPRTAVVRNLEEAQCMSPEFPVVAKPVQCEGNTGFEPIATAPALLAYLEARGLGLKNPFVVQEFIPGHDIDLSLLADHGDIVAWTMQQVRPRGVVEFLENAEVLGLGAALAKSTGYHGVLHLDMRIDERDGRVKCIEANPRFWGTQCYSTWMGVNFLSIGIQIARGEGAQIEFQPVEGLCPYVGVTSRSLPQIILGGRPAPQHLTAVQRQSWRYHHQPANAAFGEWWYQCAARLNAWGIPLWTLNS